MSVTVDYSFSGLSDDTVPTDGTVAASFSTVTSRFGGGYVVATVSSANRADLIFYDASGAVVGSDYNFQAAGHVGLAQQSNGNIIVVGAPTGGGVNFMIDDPTGGLINLGSITTTAAESNASVAALTSGAGGGFVVVDQQAFTSPDHDIWVHIRGFNGGGSSIDFRVDTGFADDENASVASLSNGNFVVAWDRTASGSSAIWYAIYDATGATIRAPAVFDSAGSINRDVQVAASGAGFTLTYTDNGWDNTQPDITTAFLGAAGNYITELRDTAETSDDSHPSATVTLSNGLVVTSFTNNYLNTGDLDIGGAVIDPTTQALLTSDSSPLYIFGSGSYVSDYSSLAALTLAQFAATSTDSTDSVTRIARLQLNRTWTGDDAGNLFTGDDAVDQEYGGAGNDTMNGGANNDMLYAYAGNDSVNGGTGNDLAYFGASFTTADTVNGGSGFDTVELSGDYSAGLTLGSAQLTAVETLQLDGGYSYAFTAGSTLLSAGKTLTVDASGLSSTDNLTFNGAATTAGGYVFLAGAGNNILTGGAGADKFVFDPATLNASDAVNGGTGSAIDTLALSAAGTITPVFFNSVSHIESLTLANGANSVTFGNALVDGSDNPHSFSVLGGTGADTVDASGVSGLNHLVLNGGAGADSLIGGSGNDIYYVDNLGDRTIESAGGGSDTVFASFSGYILGAGQSIELLATTSRAGTGTVNLTGNALAQRIDGNYGDNALTGGGGGDTMYGFQGNDTFRVTDATDRAYEAVGEGADTVFAAASYTLSAGQSIELLATTSRTGTTAINLTGNALAQRIDGNYGDNALTGGGGGDTMYGFQGNDTFRVGDATDKVYETAGQGSDTVFASLTYALQNYQSVELLATALQAGTTQITLTGNNLAQRINGNNGVNGLYGGDGNDTLYGFDGNDKLGGGNGKDALDGGAGNDIFAYSGVIQSSGPGRDVISNVNWAQDRIDLDVTVTGIDTKVVGGVLNEAAFDSNLATAIGAGQLAAHHAVLFDPSAGDADHGTNLYLVVDVNGTAGYQAGADYVFELANAAGTLVQGDFI